MMLINNSVNVARDAKIEAERNKVEKKRGEREMMTIKILIDGLSSTNSYRRSK